ncbi:MAG: cation transporter [Fibrobacter sp.]|nr:cation transporter [Fibrobacter sp.]
MDMERVKIAQRVTWHGFFVNLLLSVGKILSGIFGNSAAMVADGIHSLSDFVTDFIVIIFVRISGEDRDKGHPYGHGKFETMASMLIGMVLLAVAIGICVNATQQIYSIYRGNLLEVPSKMALIAAAVCIVVKEGLFQYTVRVGKKINSPVLIANAWHHRSDALSSIGTLIGIGGASLLGGKFTILDPIAAILVSIFIGRVAYQIGFSTIQELLEASLPEEIEKEIALLIRNTNKVRFYHNLQTRKIGNAYAIDVHIKLDRDISLVEAHDVATDIEHQLRQKYGRQTQINIHMEPLLEDGHA